MIEIRREIDKMLENPRRRFAIYKDGERIAYRDQLLECEKTVSLMNSSQRGTPNVFPAEKCKEYTRKTERERTIAELKKLEANRKYHNDYYHRNLCAKVTQSQRKIKKLSTWMIEAYMKEHPGVSKLVMANHFQVTYKAIIYHCQKITKANISKESTV